MSKVRLFKKNYKHPHLMIRNDDIDIDEFDIKYKIKSQKLNLWNLIDEYICEDNDIILIKRDDICYVILKFATWVNFIPTDVR